MATAVQPDARASTRAKDLRRSHGVRVGERQQCAQNNNITPYDIPLGPLLAKQGAEPAVRVRLQRLRKKQQAHVCFPRLTPCVISRVVVRNELPDFHFAFDKPYDAKLVTWNEYQQAKLERKYRRRRDVLAAQRHSRAGTLSMAQKQGKPPAKTKKKKKKKTKTKQHGSISRSKVCTSDTNGGRAPNISATSSMNPTPLKISRDSVSAGESRGSSALAKWEPKPIVVSPLNDSGDVNFASSVWPPIATLGDEGDQDEEDGDDDDDDDDGDTRAGFPAFGAVAGAGLYSDLGSGNELSSGATQSWGLEPGASLAQTAGSCRSRSPSGTRRPSTHR